jgi:hypothetical protein
VTTFCLNLAIIAGVLWAPVSFSSSTQFDIIYGEDNRVDTFQCTNSLFKTLAKSTAAQVANENIKIRGNTAELRGKSLGEVFKLCEKERFYHQPFVANCSGFLVAPDIMVSAGHCFEMGPSMCSKHSWVFDYKVDHEKQTNVSVPSSSVYKCKEVIEWKLTRTQDYAVIRLDRKVTDRAPVKLASDFKVGTEVVLIGHPSGLPQKIADQGFVKSVSETEFRATVDAFQINSGSAVFNAKTGDLMGILVRGKMDYRTNREFNCTEVNTTSDSDDGEDISKNTQFLPALKAAIE